MKNNTGHLIKEARLDERITQRILAKRLGYDTPQAISNIERGARKLEIHKIDLLKKSLGLTRKQVIAAMVLDYGEYLERGCEALG